MWSVICDFRVESSLGIVVLGVRLGFRDWGLWLWFEVRVWRSGFTGRSEGVSVEGLAGEQLNGGEMRHVERWHLA